MSDRRKKNEVLENIRIFGGSSPDIGYSGEKKYPRNFHPMIQYLYELIYELGNLAEVEIPNAFPITEPRYKGSNFKHSDAEMFFAVPKELLEDANSAIELCLKLKEYITGGRSILANYYPKRLEMPSYQTQIQEDQLRDDIETLDRFYDTVNKIQDKIMHSRSPHIHKIVNKKELNRLKSHIIKIGYDILTTGKNLIELYPSLLTMKETSEDPYPNFHSDGNISLHDSGVGKFVCDISDRLLEDLGSDEE